MIQNRNHESTKGYIIRTSLGSPSHFLRTQVVHRKETNLIVSTEMRRAETTASHGVWHYATLNLVYMTDD
jgi:hypothetical protein